MTAGWSALAATGTAGIPLPYAPRMDDGVALVLLGCFFLSAYALSRSRKFLQQLVKHFLLHRERNSLFATATTADIRCLLLLGVQTCILIGICLLCHFVHTQPHLVHHVPPGGLLAIYVGMCLLFVCLKWLLYSFLGWIFFDENTTTIWIESYSTLVYSLGFALFPFVLLTVYGDLNEVSWALMGGILAISTKMLALYKWIKLFCNNLYGHLLLILYFCALEIMPCVVLYHGMVQLNSFLTIKF